MREIKSKHKPNPNENICWGLRASLAWKDYIQSEEGKRLSSGEAAGQYLKNRLCRSFMAGWEKREGYANQPGVESECDC